MIGRGRRVSTAMWSGARTSTELQSGCAVAEDQPRPTERLTISASGLFKIGERGYDLEDAQMVYDP